MRNPIKPVLSFLAVVILISFGAPASKAQAFDVLEYYGSQLTKRSDSCHVRRYEYGTRYRWSIKRREAVYRWRDEKIMVRPPVYAKVKVGHGYRKRLVHAAVYRKVTRRILVAPAKNRAIRHAHKRYWPLPTEIRRGTHQIKAFGYCW